jgi:VWFA-related protein
MGNRVILGLKPDDFELRDNGVQQAITDLTNEELPLDVNFTLDLSDSLQASQLQALGLAIQQVTSTLRPLDRCGLTVFRARILERVPLSPAPLEMALSATALGKGATSLWDALTLALVTPAVIDRRQLSIMLTDGLDTSSFFDAAFVADAARHAATILHVVLTPTHQRDALRLQLRDGERLREIAETTGGRLVRLEGDASLAGTFLQSIEDLRMSYVLRYTPTGIASSGWHDIAVKVTTPGRYEVRARKGYSGG